MLFGHWVDKKEIADPYRQSKEAFEHIYKLLEESAEQWAQVLNK
ncbi:Low molecular weight protein-tyrosine-phosphatase wzb [Serratia liquefaciens]|nr:Low molecular weight protein-tyrosine-phosphatase wzb [Serratia liquefaciens]CAI2119635.1 Low molecular weight protein-tyrosine-phosphatase wzb [Serratia liquefaciens]CAI2472882.1 Low molecular weight protein-tyrosine-phosphatase wzb [Serratia liquefaciens]